MKRLTNIFLFSFLFLSVAQKEDVQGIRVDLSQELGLKMEPNSQFAQLFVPEYFEASPDGQFDLIFHLHGASWVMESQIFKSRTNAILFHIHLGPLLPVYLDPRYEWTCGLVY